MSSLLQAVDEEKSQELREQHQHAYPENPTQPLPLSYSPHQCTPQLGNQCHKMSQTRQHMYQSE